MDLVLGERIIVLVDMDCFYVQVEQNEAPEFLNKPCTVVQYNPWKGGGIIAVNYEARAFGVKRGLRGDDAKRLCPDVHNFSVPEVRGKADLTKYREAGAKVLDVLCEFSDCVERASIDEAFLDLTSVVNAKMKSSAVVTGNMLPNTFVVGWDNDSKDADISGWLESIYEDNHTLLDQKLAAAAVIVEEMRAAVYEKTKYKCSAGISHNKMLAKLACGLHKPNKQTVLPHSSVSILYKTLPVRKIRNLGGKLGEEVKEKLGAEMMGDLIKFTKSHLCDKFGEKTGAWLYMVARGIEHDAVVARQLPKSIGCGKNFRGKEALDTREKVQYWIKELASELEERLKKDQTSNQRVAKTLTVTVRTSTSNNFSNSVMITRACPIHCVSGKKFAIDAAHLIEKLNTAPASSPLWQPPVINLALTASKFEERLDSSSCNISAYFSSNKNSPSKHGAHEHGAVEQESDKIPNDSSNSNSCPELLIKSQMSENATRPKSYSKHNEVNKDRSKKSIDSYFDSVKTPKPGSNILSLENLNANHCSAPISLSKYSDSCNSNSSVDASCLETPEQKFPEQEDRSQDVQHKGFFAKKLKEKNVEPSQTEVIENLCVEPFIENTLHPKVSGNPFESDSFNIMDDSSSECASKANTDNASCSNIPSAHDNLDSPIKVQELYLANSHNLSDELTFVCSKCSLRIPIWEEQEHQDYHIALSMQDELKTGAIKPSCSVGKPKPASKDKILPKKRTLGKVSLSANKKAKQQTNTLDAFIKGM